MTSRICLVRIQSEGTVMQVVHAIFKLHAGTRQYETYFDGKMMMVYDMYLIINDICAEDIGEYRFRLHMMDSGDVMEKDMMLTGQ